VEPPKSFKCHSEVHFLKSCRDDQILVGGEKKTIVFLQIAIILSADQSNFNPDGRSPPPPTVGHMKRSSPLDYWQGAERIGNNFLKPRPKLSPP